MANATRIVLVEGAPSTVNMPAAGSVALGVDASNHGFTKNASSKIWIPGLQASITSATAGINTTETLIQALGIPVGLLQAGTTVRFTMLGTCTASAANSSTWTVRAGTAGTVSDTSVATAAVTSAASGTSVPFRAIIELTVRTAGGSGTVAGSLALTNGGTTGISPNAAEVVPLGGALTIDTTTATFLDVTYQSAAATTTTTFQNCIIEVLAA